MTECSKNTTSYFYYNILLQKSQVFSNILLKIFIFINYLTKVRKYDTLIIVLYILQHKLMLSYVVIVVIKRAWAHVIARLHEHTYAYGCEGCTRPEPHKASGRGLEAP